MAMKDPKLPKQELSATSFLPEEFIRAKSEMRANVLILGLFGVVMFAVVAAFFVTNRQWLSVRSEQEAISALYAQEAIKIEQLKELEAQKSEMLDKAQITMSLVERVPRSVLLAELITRMPYDITLLELDLTSELLKKPVSQGNGKPAARVQTLSGNAGANGEPAEEEPQAPQYRTPLTLVGVAKVNNDIADYLAALKQCDLLRDVELRYIKETTIANRDLRKFRIDAEIRPDADARSIDPTEQLDPKLAARHDGFARVEGPSEMVEVTIDEEGDDP